MKFTKQEVEEKMNDRDNKEIYTKARWYGNMAKFSALTLVIGSLAAASAGDQCLRLLSEGVFNTTTVSLILIWIAMTAISGLGLYCIRWYLRKKKYALAWIGTSENLRMKDIRKIINEDIRKIGAMIVVLAGLNVIAIGLQVPEISFFQKDSAVRQFPLSFLVYPILLIILGEFYIFQGSKPKQTKP